jgi:hypothetical protein
MENRTAADQQIRYTGFPVNGECSQVRFEPQNGKARLRNFVTVTVSEMADDQSVAGWMTMEIKMNKATRRVSEEGLWTAASLASVPIPEFFNCCSLSQNETKFKVDTKYSIETPDRRKDRRHDIRKPGTLISQKANADSTNGYQPYREDHRGLVPHGAIAKSPVKQVGKCLSDADAKKLLREMGVEEDSQVEFNGFGGQQHNLHSSSKSHQNPRVLVRNELNRRVSPHIATI